MTKTNNVLKPALILTAICLVVVLALAITYALTKDKIDEGKNKAANEANFKVMADADDFVVKKTDDGVEYLEALDKDDNLIGYVFDTEANGYGGRLAVKTGITKDGEIKGIEYVEINESKNQTDTAKSDDFKKQFTKKIPGKKFVVVTTEPAKDEEIKAITGGTVTTNAVTEAVNKAVDLFNKVTGNEQQGEEEDINLKVLPDASEFSEETTDDGVKYLAGLDNDGNIIGYVFETQEQGYKNPIIVKTGISVNGEIKGIEYVEINDSGKQTEAAKEDAFKQQFVKKIPGNKFVVVTEEPTKDEEVKAITGGTVTTTAVANAVNKAIDIYNKITG